VARRTAEEIQEGSAQQIPREQWSEFLNEFTREHRGTHAAVEILGGDDIGHAIETQDRPLDGVAADTKDGEDVIWITFGATPDDHLNHGVHEAKPLWLRQPTGGAGATLAIEAKDGTMTLVELSPEAYALPPGGNR